MASLIVRQLARSRGNGIFSSTNPRFFRRSFSSDSNLIRASLFPGDGIGPEIAESVKQVVRGVVESLKTITRHASLRVVEYAFHYAKTHGQQRVSAIHKANIMQKTDGLFLKCCREVAEKYPEITYEEVVIDNCCMMLVKNPSLFDVLVRPILYGDLISDLCAGLIGGLRLTPCCNIGEGGIALAEVIHGSALILLERIWQIQLQCF